MGLVKMQVGISGDSLLPRDQSVNTLFFSVASAVGATTDYQQLADDLGAIFQSRWLTSIGTANQIQVKAYDAEPLRTVGGLTGPPEAIAIRNAGQASPANVPREVALCLSYYAGENRPGKRGRIYLPVFAANHGNAAGRPYTAHLEAARLMALDFGNLGGTNVDWLLFSPKLRQTYKVTNAWCDNEWDTQRSRGLKPTSRVTAVLSE